VNDWAFLAAVVVSVFALVDPLGTLPFYVSLTDGFDDADRAIIVAAFGFTLQAFEIAGGILLFAVAFDMMRGEASRTRLAPADRQETLSRRDEIAVVPLGIPLLAGPGAISTVMIYEGYAGSDPIALFATFIAIGIAGVSTFFVLEYGHGILRYMGRVGVMALTRVLGLVLAAVAVQFTLNGVLAVIAHA
jgi:multiple antibiotic resistance protein